jgi:hypothetical protein
VSQTEKSPTPSTHNPGTHDPTHQATGEFDLTAGTVLTGEQAQAFGDVFSRRIVQLSRQPALTPSQASFIDDVVAYGSRNIVNCLDNGMRLPDGMAGMLRHEAATFAEWASLPPASEPIGNPDRVHGQGVIEALSPLTDFAASIKSQPSRRPNAEDFGSIVVTAFGDMVAASAQPLVLDGYL